MTDNRANDNVFTFPRGRKVTPDEEAQAAMVRMLETQLRLVKDGKISFVAFAAVSKDLVAYSGWAPDCGLEGSVATAAVATVAFLDARFKESVLVGAEEHIEDTTPGY